MAPPHPLDRPVWSALTSRQAHVAVGDVRALRFGSDFGVFAAAADESPANLAALSALAGSDGRIWLVEAADFALPVSMQVQSRALCHQMVAAGRAPGAEDETIAALSDSDAPDMLALATLTEPGPFFHSTHRLGRFIGIKDGDRLVAMAGERMQPTGFTEVSGVCTHPDYRGRGYARRLIAIVANRIQARGDVPFLHVYASNSGAIALYETLGFTLRRELTMTVLAHS